MMYEQLAEALRTSLTQFVVTATEYLPNMVAAFVLILFGWLLGRFVDASLRRLIHGVLHPFARRGSGRGSERDVGAADRIGASFGSVGYWLVVAVFLLAAVRVLDLPILDELVAELGGYLPKLAAVGAILLGGYVAGFVARGAITRSLTQSGIAYADATGRLGQSLIVLTASIVAIDELGIDTTFVAVIFGIIAGATLLGAALALGIGSGPSVANLLAAYHVQRNYRVGQTVRVAGVVGRILEIGDTSIIIESGEGRICIPARRFIEEVSVLVTEGA
jgi:small-conductance mechanosensitive channel